MADPLEPTATVPPEPSGSMRERIYRGLLWKGGSTAFGYVTRLAVAATLAHLLTPRDYGLAGMVLAFSGLVYLFSDLSFGTALIQRAHLDERDRSTVFWTSAAGGLLFTVLGVALSWPIAAFYGEPEVQPLFAVLSLGFVLGAISSTQFALLTRDMDFRSLEIREMTSSLVAGAVGIVVAAKGFGAWALIVQQLTATTISTVLLWRYSTWRPRLTYSWTSFRRLGGYSGNVFAARLLFFVNRNVDNILIGRFLGPAALGAYAVSYNLMLYPLSQISLPLQEVLFPAFSRMQEDVAKIKAAWLRANRVVGAITIPAMLGLIVVAPDFVAVILGDQWDSATPVLQILAWVGLLQSLQGLNGSVLRAVDRTGTLFRYSVIVVAAGLASIAIGIPWGIVGVAAAYAAVSTIVEPFYAWVTARAVGGSLWEFTRPLLGTGAAGLAMAVCVLVVRLSLEHAGVSTVPRLAICVTTGVAVYVALVSWREPALLAELRGLRHRSA